MVRSQKNCPGGVQIFAFLGNTSGRVPVPPFSPAAGAALARLHCPSKKGFADGAGAFAARLKFP